VERARAWDDEQDRLKREAFSREIAEIGKRHASQAKGVAQILMLPVMAAAKKLQSTKNDISALENMDLTDLFRLASSTAGLLTAMQRAERDAYGLDPNAPAVLSGGRAGSRGGEAAGAVAAPVSIAGAEFAWVQGKCTCGHTHSVHDQTNENPSIVPCTAKGCGCKKYRDVEDADYIADDDDEQASVGAGASAERAS
jgi:hypothetical protein